MPQVNLPKAEVEKVKALQAQIAELIAAGKEREEREAEEQAMHILGYKSCISSAARVHVLMGEGQAGTLNAHAMISIKHMRDFTRPMREGQPVRQP